VHKPSQEGVSLEPRPGMARVCALATDSKATHRLGKNGTDNYHGRLEPPFDLNWDRHFSDDPWLLT